MKKASKISKILLTAAVCFFATQPVFASQEPKKTPKSSVIGGIFKDIVKSVPIALGFIGGGYLINKFCNRLKLPESSGAAFGLLWGSVLGYAFYHFFSDYGRLRQECERFKVGGAAVWKVLVEKSQENESLKQTVNYLNNQNTEWVNLIDPKGKIGYKQQGSTNN